MAELHVRRADLSAAEKEKSIGCSDGRGKF